MKRIVELSENDYKALKEDGVHNHLALADEIIAHSEPYEEKPQDQWIPVSERLPEEKINPKTNDLEEVLCTTIWGDVRHYKYGKPIGYDEAHFWYGWGIMDKDVIAWQPLPEPYKKGGADMRTEAKA